MDRLLTRSRAQQLDDALTAPPSRSGGVAPIEVALAGRLREAGSVTGPVPTPAFREALRTRLMAVAAVQGVGSTAPSPSPVRSAVSWRYRAATVGAGVMATVVAAGGVAVASSRALPGDPFYSVKRTTEGLQLRVADGNHEQGTRHLEFAATRMREVRALVLGREADPAAVATSVVAPDVEQRVDASLADMDVDTRTGLRLLTGAFRDSRATAPLEELSRFAAAQGRGLLTVLPALTGTARVQAQESLSLVQGVRAEADELLMLVDCTAACDPAQVAPVAPAPGVAVPPCRCPTGVPAPQTAPVPPSSTPAAPPGTSQVGPAEPGPNERPSDPSSSPPPSSPSSPRPPSQQPEPGLPLVPSLPLPSLPAQPLAPSGPTVQLPSVPGDLLPGLIGAAPMLTTATGPLRAALSMLLGPLGGRR
jgi:hypothetical protein